MIRLSMNKNEIFIDYETYYLYIREMKQEENTQMKKINIEHLQNNKGLCPSSFCECLFLERIKMAKENKKRVN